MDGEEEGGLAILDMVGMPLDGIHKGVIYTLPCLMCRLCPTPGKRKMKGKQIMTMMHVKKISKMTHITITMKKKLKLPNVFSFFPFFMLYLYVVIYFDMFYFLYIYICMENSSTMSEIQRLVPLSVLCANWSLEACCWQGNHGNPCWGHG